jgi:hypothetical protein
MANFRYIPTLLSFTPTADSADSNWPATNVNVLSDLSAKWAAAVATGIINFTLDFGVGNTLSGLAANPAIGVDDCNVTSLRIQGNSVTTDWVTPPWDQAITVAKHKGVGRYKDFRRLLDLSASAFAYRYLNIRIVSQTPTDGENYRIGRVGVGQIVEPVMNPSYDSVLTIDQMVRDTELEHGGFQPNIMGEPFARMVFPQRLASVAARDDYWDFDAMIGRGVICMVWDASEGGTQDGWFMRRVSPSELTKEFNAYYRTSRQLREVI